MKDRYPQDHDFTEEDDERWLRPAERPLTPEEAFDLFFEGWQAAEEDTHMQQVLAALDAQGRAHDTPARPTPSTPTSQD